MRFIGCLLADILAGVIPLKLRNMANTISWPLYVMSLVPFIRESSASLQTEKSPNKEDQYGGHVGSREVKTDEV